MRLGEWLGDLAGRRIAVGFSGGRDSVALLHALAALRAETAVVPTAIHVHHGLSPQAERWVAFAENFCNGLDIPLTVVRVAVALDSGRGLEAAARAARYQAFAALPVDLLLLAHHRDDQAETLLFNLLRGTGVHGAAAMPPLRQISRPAGGELALGRPWLDVPRADIDAYRAVCGLSNIEDESNQDQRFSRNHLRHEIFPRLELRYPQVAASLAGAARRFGDAAHLLDELAELDLKLLTDGVRLDWAGLARLAEPRQRNLLRRWLALGGESLASESALCEFLRQCREASADAAVAAPFGALILRRWQGGLYRLARREEAPSPDRPWRGESRLDWSGGRLNMVGGRGDGLRADLLGGLVELRRRQGNELIRLRPGGPRRPLRLLFQERGVPPWERSRLPFLWVGGVLAAVGGIGVAAEFQAAGEQASVSFDWVPAG